MMTTKTKDSKARDRILQKAEELFYTQGYQATGINQIIEEAGVAKATFYANFPSKDDLCVAYLQTMGRKEEQTFAEALAQQKTPLGRFMCTAELLIPWLEESEYRGCAFLNTIPEVPNFRDPIRKEAEQFYRNYESLMIQLSAELIESDRKRYGHLNAEALARSFIVLVAGGVALSALHHSLEPMKNAIGMIRQLVGE